MVLCRSIGYAACYMLRLIIGRHHYPDLNAMEPRSLRAACELQCLQLGQALLLERRQFSSMAEVVQRVEVELPLCCKPPA